MSNLRSPTIYLPILAGSGLCLGLVICFLTSDAGSWLNHLLATAIVALGSLPLFVYMRRNQWSVFPVFQLNSLYYAVGFGVGGFYRFPIKYAADYSTDGLAYAQVTCIVGLLSQIVGYALLSFHRAKHSQVPLLPRMSLGELVFCGWTLVIVGATPLLIPQLTEVPSLSMFLRLASFGGASVLFYCAVNGSLSKAAIFCFSVIEAFVLWKALLTGALAEPLRYALLFCLVLVISRKRCAAVFLAVAAIYAFATFNPVKIQYRNAVWWQANDLTDFEKTALWIKLIKKEHALSERERYYIRRDGNTLFGRISQLPFLTIVTEQTPRVVPYWNGETLKDMPYSFIPRALWPGKPVKRTGNEFGHRYGILSPGDKWTSINLPWVVELYANFGMGGTAIGMLVVGMLFGWLERHFLAVGAMGPQSIMTIGLFGPLVVPESSISLMWGGVFLGWFALWGATRAAKAVLRGNLSE